MYNNQVFNKICPAIQVDISSDAPTAFLELSSQSTLLSPNFQSCLRMRQGNGLCDQSSIDGSMFNFFNKPEDFDTPIEILEDIKDKVSEKDRSPDIHSNATDLLKLYFTNSALEKMNE